MEMSNLNTSHKTVYELAERVGEQHCRTDQAQLGGREGPAVDKRLLDHAERHTADIVLGIRRTHTPESPGAQTAVFLPDLFGRHALPGRL